jgi:uncharacterized membrane protein YidH (DUF202 family)
METTTTTNADTGNRIDQFKSDVTELNLKAGNAGREKIVAAFGVLLIIVGIGGAFLAYVSSKNLNDARDVQTQIVFAVAFLTLVVAGAALFIRYSFAAFLRMWLLRNLYEGQANTDRIVEAIADSKA